MRNHPDDERHDRLQRLAAERVGLPAVTTTAGALLCAQAVVARFLLRRSTTGDRRSA